MGRGWLRLIAVGFFVSGAAGLVDEVVWSKYLALLIGGDTVAQTIVLATFMGGLALGNTIFGRRADRSPDLIRLYALLELSVGGYCLAFPEIFGLVGEAYVALARPLGFGTPSAYTLKLFAAAMAILPPTILMGGTLPILAKVLVRGVDDVTSDVGRLYFINTFGALVGVALAGFVLIPAAGLADSLRFSGVANVLVGMGFLLANRKWADRPALEAATAPPRETAASPPLHIYTPRQRRVVLLAITIAGGTTMLFEIVWSRLLALVLGSSAYSFSIMLLTFIAGIAFGALAVRRAFSAGPSDRGHHRPAHRDPLRWLAGAELGIFLSILVVVPLCDRLPFYFARIAMLIDRSPEAFPLFLALKIVFAFVVMFLPAFFIGMTLPLASRVTVDHVASVGRKVGWVFSVNTLGSVAGVVFTGLLLIPALELRGTLLLGVGIVGLLGVTLLWVGADRRWRFRAGVPALVAAAFLLVAALLPPWNRLVLNLGLYRYQGVEAATWEELLASSASLELLDAHDGRDSSVAVVRNRRTGNLYLKVNGKSDAGTAADMLTQLWLGHLGMLLNPEAERALVIGLGSGVTCASILRHPGARVEAIEISPSVVRAAQKWFGPYNDQVLANPRMRLHVGDAKEFFRLNPDAAYDLVVSEPSNPWISGIGNLFSLEYFTDIRDHLRPHGLLVQWIHLYELSDDLVRLVLNTVGAVFDHVEVWQTTPSEVILVASPDPIEADPAHIRRRLAMSGIRSHLGLPGSGGLRAVLGRQMLSASRFRRSFPGEPPHNTDLHPVLEYEAPKSFFAKQTATLLDRLDERRLPPVDRKLHLTLLHDP